MKHSNFQHFLSKSLDPNTQAHMTKVHQKCSGSCEPGSRCHPNECIFGGGKPQGVGILEAGVYEQGKGNGEGSLQAIGDQGWTDPVTARRVPSK